MSFSISAAKSLLTPKNNDVAIVDPLLDIPGNIAKACAIPIIIVHSELDEEQQKYSKPLHLELLNCFDNLCLMRMLKVK